MIESNQAAGEKTAAPVRVDVQALVYSEALTAEEIESRLNLSPSETQEKGPKYGKRTGTRVDVPRHMWQLSSELNVSEMDFSSHLDWVLAKLFSVRERLQALRDSAEVECFLVGVVWTSGTSAHVRLSVHHLEILAALRLEFRLEFADYGDDD